MPCRSACWFFRCPLCPPFEELKLEIPATIKELLALARKWAEGLGRKILNTLFSATNMNSGRLTRLVMESYINTAFGAERTLFDTPLFRS